LASGIYLLLSSDGKKAGWIRFLHNSSIEDESVNIFLGMMMWRLFFERRHQGGDDVAAMKYFSPVSSLFCCC
jgi:hypothetical protein